LTPTDELEKAALEAISSAADRLGVDPFRLARFLAHGRIADFLQALGRGEALEVEKAETTLLADRYVAFVEQERTLRETDAGGAANGG
jgi:hypothetical protein